MYTAYLLQTVLIFQLSIQVHSYKMQCVACMSPHHKYYNWISVTVIKLDKSLSNKDTEHNSYGTGTYEQQRNLYKHSHVQDSQNIKIFHN